MKKTLSVAIATILLCLVGRATANGSLVQDFPTTSDGVGDPDSVLSENHRQALADKIESAKLTVIVDEKEVDVQIAVAVVEKVRHSSSIIHQPVQTTPLTQYFISFSHDRWICFLTDLITMVDTWMRK